MSVNVSKFTKKKEGSTSVVVNNSNKGYSNTTTVGSLDRMLWNIHDTGQDITETPTLPALNVNGQINAGGKIISNTEVNAPTGRFSYLYGTDIHGTNANISYITSKFITTDDLKVNNTAEIKNIISEHISTQYLDVTKSAHFAELVIDKIKSVGGSAVFSPADGFKIASEDDIIQIYDSNGNATNYWMLCWDGEDDRGATVNMWERNDQALCQNFNEATTGVSYNVSNTYFWMLVFTAGTYNPEDPAEIKYDHCTQDNYMSENAMHGTGYRQKTAYRYNDDELNNVEKVTFDTLKHYIVVYNNPDAYFADAEYENSSYHAERVMDGTFNPKPGNEIVMLGHRARQDELGNFEYMKRQSAIYIAAYNSTIEPDLMAPLIAQYQGINDFDLSSHRTTHFAAGHNDIFGYDNVIKGSFKTINGTDITDLNGVTYFIKSNKAYIPVTSDWFIGNNTFNISLDCMYISGDNGPAYVGTRNNNMKLRIQYSYNGGQPKNKDAEYSYISNSYTFDLQQFVSTNTNGYIDSLSFLIMEGTNIVYQYNIPVIQQSGSNPGDDAEFYKLNPIRELAQVDVEGNFALYLQYEVQHIIGDEITTADNTDYSIQFTIWDENNNREQTKTVPYVSPYFTYDKDGNPAYEKVNVFGTYNSRSLLHDQYIEVKLIRNNGDVVVERRVIPVTLVAGAMFSVTDSITSRVTASETTANTAYNMASQAVQTAQGFDQRVTRTETDINNQQNTITGLQTDVSRIQQTADTITSEITKISGVGGENLIVNSSFQVVEENNLPERWELYNENTLVTTHESGSVNYVNINNNINQGDGNYRGIVQNSTERYNNNIQDLYPNHIYCFSFYGKKNSSYGAISCFIHYTKSDGTTLRDGNDDIQQVSSNFDIGTTDWQRYCFIFKTIDNNEIFSFNIMLEYYYDSISNKRENDVDIMMPMLLDLGEATEERITLYGPFYSNKNENYNVSQVPMWQGNSQDVSVSSSQILQTADLIRLQVENCGIDITNQNITLNGDTIINGTLDVNSNDGFNLNNADGNVGTKIHGGSIPTYNDWITLTATDITRNGKITKTFSNIGTSQSFEVSINDIDLGLYYQNDALVLDQISLRTGVLLTSCTVIAKLYRGTTFLRSISKTLTQHTTYQWNVDFSDNPDTYLVQATGKHTIDLTFRCVGTPNFENHIFSGIVHLSIPREALIEIGSNGIATRESTDNYNYMSEQRTEFKHDKGGISIHTNGTYSAGTLYYATDRTSNNQNGTSSWRSLNSVPVTTVTSETYNVQMCDCMILVYNTINNSTGTTLTLSTNAYDGQVIYIRMLTTNRSVSLSASTNIIWPVGTTNRTSSYNLLNTSNNAYYAKLVYDKGFGCWIIMEIK